MPPLSVRVRWKGGGGRAHRGRCWSSSSGRTRRPSAPWICTPAPCWRPPWRPPRCPSRSGERSWPRCPRCCPRAIPCPIHLATATARRSVVSGRFHVCLGQPNAATAYCALEGSSAPEAFRPLMLLPSARPTRRVEPPRVHASRAVELLTVELPPIGRVPIEL